MTLKLKCHKRAFKERVQLGFIGNILAISADLLWLTRDIMLNGLDIIFLFVSVGLIGGLIITMYASIQHQRCLVRDQIREMTEVRKQRTAVKKRAIIRRNREKGV